MLISPLVQSQAVPYGMEIKWNEWLRTNIPLCNIPEVCSMIDLHFSKPTEWHWSNRRADFVSHYTPTKIHHWQTSTANCLITRTDSWVAHLPSKCGQDPKPIQLVRSPPSDDSFLSIFFFPPSPKVLIQMKYRYLCRKLGFKKPAKDPPVVPQISASRWIPHHQSQPGRLRGIRPTQ